jgi:protein MpaA
MTKYVKLALGACVVLLFLLQGCTEAPDDGKRADQGSAGNATPTQPQAAAETAAADTPSPERGESHSYGVQAKGMAQSGVVVEPDQPSGSPIRASIPLTAEELAAHQGEVDKLCAQIGNKLTSVNTKDCLDQLFRFGGGYSVQGRPLIFKDMIPGKKQPKEFRVLLMGGVHGDEYSSISIIFKWLQLFSPKALEGEYHWRFAPLVNPDGLLEGKQANRQNANGVDLNRNFPSEDWNATAVGYWQDSTGSNPRRFPGKGAASEPEVRWIVQQMIDFRPDVIVSVHAPYHLLDFDGPREAPNRIGELYLHQLGVYPGSLGNYAGLNKSIPVVTLELPSAGIMPQAAEIKLMWSDLVSWLDSEGRKKMPGNQTAQAH